MLARVARPTGSATNAPGIIVFQEAFGVNGHICDIAGRFADLGFTAIAPALYHRTGEDVQLSYSGPQEERQKHSGAVTVEGLSADIKATFEWLTKEGKVAAERTACIGFCMGGRVSFLANGLVPLAGAVSFYGGRSNDLVAQFAKSQHAPIMQFWGGQDKAIPKEQRREVQDGLDAAGKPHQQVLFSYAEHGFFCNERPSYNADAARQAWAITLEYLRVRKVLA
jgi:carboxymethylenebutenolidase